jgi:hypothetical protein
MSQSESHYRLAQPNTAMQPTPSVWPIFALGSMLLLSASATPVLASRARLMGNPLDATQSSHVVAY